MFVVLLKFAENRDAAPRHMEGHKAWLEQGFADGVFLLAGGLAPAAGGAVLARGDDRRAIERRVAVDPFVAHGVVVPEILEIAPARVDDRLAPLLGRDVAA